MDTKKVSLIVAILAIVISLSLAVYVYLSISGSSIKMGSVGDLLVEDYIPVIKYNDGYNSALDIKTSGTLTTTGTNSLTGTSTISKSYDGMILQANFTMSTGTAKAAVSNSTGVDMMCKEGGAYFNATGFAPGLYVSIGTSTSATGYVTGLVSSSTVGTSSDTMISPLDAPFFLATGSSIVAALSDANSLASSTYLSNWDGEMGFHCWLMGQ